jgi:hypothetical protein
MDCDRKILRKFEGLTLHQLWISTRQDIQQLTQEMGSNPIALAVIRLLQRRLVWLRKQSQLTLGARRRVIAG